MPSEPQITNEEQREYWTGESGNRWVVAQTSYDAMLAPYAEAVLERARIGSSELVLDVGCGTGSLTRSAVAGGAGAIGLDISSTMVAGALSLTDGDNPGFVVADAQVAPVDPCDVVISRFGVMFFDDPVAAFSNLRSTGARLTFACWQQALDNEWVVVPTGVIIDVLGELPAMGDPEAPGPFAFADRDRVAAILHDAGWKGIEIEPVSPDLLIGGPGTAADAAGFATYGGPAARMLTDQPTEVVDRIRAQMEERFAEHVDPDEGGVRLGSRGWIVTAQA